MIDVTEAIRLKAVEGPVCRKCGRGPLYLNRWGVWYVPAFLRQDVSPPEGLGNPEGEYPGAGLAGWGDDMYCSYYGGTGDHARHQPEPNEREEEEAIDSILRSHAHTWRHA